MKRPLIASSCTILLYTSFALLAEDSTDGKREAMFPRFDTNGDGVISKEEWMSSKGAQKNTERAQKKFTQMDKDGDGNLSKEEFLAPAGGKATGGAADGEE
jgi:Ca2+-binding EF-hand superfamily protein